MAKISIALPVHDMPNGEFFLDRALESIKQQSFKDYEIVITRRGKMAQNTNAAIKKSKGELIKILYMDDYFAHENALQEIVDNFTPNTFWLATGCLHQKTEEGYYEDPHSPHYPEYTKNISTGNNRIGSPSVITLRNEGHLLFDENMSWLLDCDLYKRYYDKYGKPTILNDLNVTIGIGTHQTTYALSEQEKLSEHYYLEDKYAK